MRSTTKADRLSDHESRNHCDFKESITIDKADGPYVTINNQSMVDLGAANPHAILGFNPIQTKQAIKQHYESPQVCPPFTSRGFTQALRSFRQNLLPSGYQVLHTMAHDSLCLPSLTESIRQLWQIKNEPQRQLLLSFASHQPIFLGGLGNDGQPTLEPQASVLPYPFTWTDDPSIDTKESLALQRLEKKLSQLHEKTLAFYMEPILQTASGMRLVRPEFLDRACRLIKQYDIPIIADERMLSPYRSGKRFAYMHLNFIPDFIILGPQLCNGQASFGLTLAKENLAKTLVDSPGFTQLSQQLEQPSPIAYALLEATSEAFYLDTHQKLAHKLTQIQKERARELMQAPIVKHVRQFGTIVAFDLVCETAQQNAQAVHWFTNTCQTQQILLGHKNHSLVIAPCLNPGLDLHLAYDKIQQAIHHLPLHRLTAS